MKNLTTATIEDTTITLIWGDSREFMRRMEAYADRTGANIHMVIPMPISSVP